MKRVVLVFGLLAGVLMSVMMLGSITLLDGTSFEHSLVIGYTTMVLAFLFVYFGIRSYRDTVGGGTISFGRATAVGSLIALIACVCYVATWVVVYNRFMPDFPEKYAAHAMAEAKASGATAEQLAAKAQQMADFQKAYRNPLVVIGYTFLEPLPVALIMTLVSAGLLRRRRPEREDELPVTLGARSPAL